MRCEWATLLNALNGNRFVCLINELNNHKWCKLLINFMPTDWSIINVSFSFRYSWSHCRGRFRELQQKATFAPTDVSAVVQWACCAETCGCTQIIAHTFTKVCARIFLMSAHARASQGKTKHVPTPCLRWSDKGGRSGGQMMSKSGQRRTGQEEQVGRWQQNMKRAKLSGLASTKVYSNVISNYITQAGTQQLHSTL